MSGPSPNPPRSLLPSPPVLVEFRPLASPSLISREPYPLFPPFSLPGSPSTSSHPPRPSSLLHLSLFSFPPSSCLLVPTRRGLATPFPCASRLSVLVSLGLPLLLPASPFRHPAAVASAVPFHLRHSIPPFFFGLVRCCIFAFGTGAAAVSFAHSRLAVPPDALPAKTSPPSSNATSDQRFHSSRRRPGEQPEARPCRRLSRSLVLSRFLSLLDRPPHVAAPAISGLLKQRRPPPPPRPPPFLLRRLRPCGWPSPDPNQRRLFFLPSHVPAPAAVNRRANSLMRVAAR
ncbi:hypothetical protein CDD83_9892 [Cordyceps sp. RAO-2017]|nr:hypothetical protein CDD83_9892 [Cordyceps sp. RAO-2017]